MIAYEINRFGHLTVRNVGKPALSMYVQVDWDYPSVASTFGFVACECGATDGTVDCAHKTAREMIAAAYEYLVEHEGEQAEDPGYFDGQEESQNV